MIVQRCTGPPSFVIPSFLLPSYLPPRFPALHRASRSQRTVLLEVLCSSHEFVLNPAVVVWYAVVRVLRSIFAGVLCFKSRDCVKSLGLWYGMLLFVCCSVPFLWVLWGLVHFNTVACGLVLRGLVGHCVVSVVQTYCSVVCCSVGVLLGAEECPEVWFSLASGAVVSWKSWQSWVQWC